MTAHATTTISVSPKAGRRKAGDGTGNNGVRGAESPPRAESGDFPFDAETLFALAIASGEVVESFHANTASMEAAVYMGNVLRSLDRLGEILHTRGATVRKETIRIFAARSREMLALLIKSLDHPPVVLGGLLDETA